MSANASARRFWLDLTINHPNHRSDPVCHMDRALLSQNPCSSEERQARAINNQALPVACSNDRILSTPA